MSMEINCKAISDSIKEKVKAEIEIIGKPTLAILQFGDNEASNSYIKSKLKACSEVGIDYRYEKLPIDTSFESALKLVQSLNLSTSIHAIIIQLPLPAHLSKLPEYINWEKDVDGLSVHSTVRQIAGLKAHIPCTAQAVADLICSFKDQTYLNTNLQVVNTLIIGRSKLVGIPLARLLIGKNANITICHSKTVNLMEFTKFADIIISCTGVAGLLKPDMLSDYPIVIDVGISRVNIDGKSKLQGDLSIDAIEYTSAYTPVPRGVGLLTVAQLMKSVLNAYKWQNPQNEILLSDSPTLVLKNETK